MDPAAFGWPVSRKRKYVVARHLAKTHPWSMTLTDFIARLTCSPKCKTSEHCPAWDVFFVASDEELRSEMEWARGRPSALTKSQPTEKSVLEPDAFANSLNRMERAFLDDYEKMHPGLCYSLAQNPKVTATHSSRSTLHTLIKNAGIVWSDHHVRWLTPDEALLAQGLPVYPMLSYEVPMTSYSFAGSETSRTAKIGQAGNTMHSQCIGAVLLFVVTHGGMSLEQMRALGLHEGVCRRYVPGSFLSAPLGAFARLVAGLRS